MSFLLSISRKNSGFQIKFFCLLNLPSFLSLVSLKIIMTFVSLLILVNENMFLPVEHRSWNTGWKTPHLHPTPEIILKFFIKLYNCLSVCISVCLYICMSVYLSVCIYVCLSVKLQVYGSAKRRQFCLQSLGTKGTLHTPHTLQNN